MTKPDPEFVAFLRAYPTYPTTHIIDDLRAVEYARLDLGGHIYLDYTGGGLYADSQLRRHNRLLSEHVFGNPHSSNPSSQAATQLVEHAREYVLKFFNADPDEYLAIFTSNASGALKLVGESYPFPNGRYLLTIRQSQLGQWDSGIRSCTQRECDVHPRRIARHAGGRFATGTGACPTLEKRTQPFCLSGPIQFLVSQTSTRMD